MNVKSVGTDGQTVYWNLSDTKRDELNNGLARLGKGQAKERSNSSALRCAMMAYGEDKLSRKRERALVRPHNRPQKHGYTLIIETPEDDQVLHDKQFSASVDDDGNIDVWAGYADMYRLEQFYGQAKRVLPAESVVVAIVNILEGWYPLGAVRLRERGGLYWIPEQVVPEWEEVTTVIEAAALVEGSNMIEGMTSKMDHRTARSLRRSYTTRIREEAEDMLQDVCSGGTDMAQNRLDKAKALHTDVKAMETILNETLDELHAELAKVEQVAAVACMQK